MHQHNTKRWSVYDSEQRGRFKWKFGGKMGPKPFWEISGGEGLVSRGHGNPATRKHSHPGSGTFPSLFLVTEKANDSDRLTAKRRPWRPLSRHILPFPWLRGADPGFPPKRNSRPEPSTLLCEARRAFYHGGGPCSIWGGGGGHAHSWERGARVPQGRAESPGQPSAARVEVPTGWDSKNTKPRF